MEFIGDSWTDADVVGEALGASAYDTKYFNVLLAYSRLTSIAYHAQDRINFPANLSGTEKEIVVYDCSGRIERKLITRKQTVSLCKDFGLAERMYIVKTAKLE